MGSSDVSKPTKGKKGSTIPSKIGIISTAASIPGVAALERRILYIMMHHYRAYITMKFMRISTIAWVIPMGEDVPKSPESL